MTRLPDAPTREDLITRIILLEEQLKGYSIPSEWGFNKAEATLFDALQFGRYASIVALEIAFEKAGYNLPSYNWIQVTLRRVRKKLAEHDSPFVVVVMSGVGWRLEARKEGQ